MATNASGSHTGSALEVGIESRIEVGDEGVLLLSGELSFSSVPGLLRESQSLLVDGSRSGSGRSIIMDLQGVSRTDSAGLALLVEWRRSTRHQGASITFLNIPAQMMALAHLSGLVEVLSLPHTTQSQ